MAPFDVFCALLFILEAVVALYLVQCLLDSKRYRLNIPTLSDVRPPLPPQTTPALSVGVVVPARDEEKRIGACLRSLATSQGLTRLRIIAVDDRSRDATKNRMEDVAKDHSAAITVVPLRELPPAWLGKTHACWTGARLLRMEEPVVEYLLFTDADVIFHERALFEGALLMKRENLDFLTLFPKAEYQGRWEGAFLSFFSLSLSLFTQPWRLPRPGGMNHIGIGAFLMVRTDRYFQLGGHEKLRMSVAEDLKMGLLFRAAGLKLMGAAGSDRVRVRWQEGFFASLRGMVKNGFAGHDYSVLMLIGALFAQSALFLGPFMAMALAPVATTPWSALLATVGAGNGLLLFASYHRNCKLLHYPTVLAWSAAPLMMIAYMGAMTVSAVRTLLSGGISWRDSFYPLPDLKRGNFSFLRAWRGRSALQKLPP
jgi:glycosyltransferase involved in cell wall biosynthesis